MTRKDTILIAVVINAGLLAILFATAIIYDNENLDVPDVITTALVETKEVFPETPLVTEVHTKTGDEVDNVLHYYSQPSHQSLAAEPQPESFVKPQFVAAAFEQETAPATIIIEKKEHVEVVVKKGDSLDKIARANGSTVAAIKNASQLENEKLSIGQVLKVPLKSEKEVKVTTPLPAELEIVSADAVYYTLKSGDNPWKIAKQFNVSTDDIVKLNNLDEVKARNLKAGDRIRVK